MRNIFFDLDGTLTNSKEGIINSVLYALNKMKIQEQNITSLNSFIGPPLKNSFKEKYALSDQDANRAVEYYREYFSEKGLYENQLYDGIEKILIAMKQANMRLWVVTSKPKIYADKIISYFSLLDYFESVIGSNLDNTLTDKTELIAHTLDKIAQGLELKNCVMIGDRKHDIIGAKNNNIKSCGVLYGFGSKQEIMRAAPDYISETTSGLINIFCENN